MKKVTIEVPPLYGDHHVVEVRRILLEMPGVMDVYASSAFHLIEVTYDPDQVNDLQISMKLDEAGYLGEWTPPIESGVSAQESSGKEMFNRHTAIFETSQQVVSFAQNVSYSGRPLWNCPGFGVIHNKMED